MHTHAHTRAWETSTVTQYRPLYVFVSICKKNVIVRTRSITQWPIQLLPIITHIHTCVARDGCYKKTTNAFDLYPSLSMCTIYVKKLWNSYHTEIRGLLLSGTDPAFPYNRTRIHTCMSKKYCYTMLTNAFDLYLFSSMCITYVILQRSPKPLKFLSC